MGIVANGKRTDGRRSRIAPPDRVPSRVGMLSLHSRMLTQNVFWLSILLC